MLTNKVKAVLIAAGAAACVAAGWQVRDWQHDAAELASVKAQEQTRELLHELASKVSASTEAAVGQIRVENRTIYQKAVHEVQTNTIYSDEHCRLPAGGVRAINEARAAANASISAVPAPAAAK